jgi:hypothetical protein
MRQDRIRFFFVTGGDEEQTLLPRIPDLRTSSYAKVPPNVFIAIEARPKDSKPIVLCGQIHPAHH